MLTTWNDFKLIVVQAISDPNERATVLGLLNEFRQEVHSYYAAPDNALPSAVEEGRALVRECLTRDGTFHKPSLERNVIDLVGERNRLAHRLIGFVNVATGEIT